MHRKWIKGCFCARYMFILCCIYHQVQKELSSLSFRWSKVSLRRNGCKIFHKVFCFLCFSAVLVLWNPFLLSRFHHGHQPCKRNRLIMVLDHFLNTLNWFLLLRPTLMASHRLTIRRLSVVCVSVNGFCSRKTIKLAHNQQKVNRFKWQSLQSAK